MTTVDQGSDTSGPTRTRAGLRSRLVNAILVYCLFGITYSAFIRVGDFNRRYGLPEAIFPFHSWAMFKLMLRSESVIRLVGQQSNGERESIRPTDIFSYASLEGRTVLDHTATVGFLRLDYVSRTRRAALARAIERSALARSGRFERISALVETFDVYTGQVFARFPLLSVDVREPGESGAYGQDMPSGTVIAKGAVPDGS